MEWLRQRFMPSAGSQDFLGNFNGMESVFQIPRTNLEMSWRFQTHHNHLRSCSLYLSVQKKKRKKRRKHLLSVPSPKHVNEDCHVKRRQSPYLCVLSLWLSCLYRRHSPARFPKLSVLVEAVLVLVSARDGYWGYWDWGDGCRRRCIAEGEKEEKVKK